MQIFRRHKQGIGEMHEILVFNHTVEVSKGSMQYTLFFYSMSMCGLVPRVAYSIQYLCWCIGALVHRCIGALVHWCMGT
jgi:hypothetical protein